MYIISSCVFGRLKKLIQLNKYCTRTVTIHVLYYIRDNSAIDQTSTQRVFVAWHFTGKSFFLMRSRLLYKTFCGFSMGRNQYWAGRVYDLCVYYMTGTPEGSTESTLMNYKNTEISSEIIQLLTSTR